MTEEAIQRLVIAAKQAALFMDIAIPLQGDWEDAFQGDLKELRSAIRGVENIMLGDKLAA